MTALAAFAQAPRWIAWRNEPRSGKLTKIPYSPASGRPAEANDPRTWGIRDAAEQLARRIVNGAGGGVGIELGELGDGWSLGGVDLDTCRAADGTLTPWALTVIERLASYTEISPSETGAKILFRYRSDDLPALRAEMGGSLHGKQFKLAGGGKDHPPAIELYLGNRYFAITEWHLPESPIEITEVDASDILWLLREFGPEFSGGGEAPPSGGKPSPRDNSRSAVAYRMGREFRKAGATFDEMCAALRDHPDTAEWYREKGDKRQLQRIWNKAESAASRGLPAVFLGGGKLPKNLDEAEALLIEHDPSLFQRGDMVVRPARELIAISDHRQALAVRLVTVRPAHLVDRLTRIADFKRYDARSEEWVSVNCPPELATAYLERIGEWRLPLLRGVIDVPTLRPDGAIMDEPGYNSETGILYVPSGDAMRVPHNPSQADARAALDVLCELLSGFPFVDADGNCAPGLASPSRSVALSLILTALMRRSIDHAPLHAFDAPVMGSGKSKLVDIASMIATGHEAPVISQGKTEEEMEKRLGAALIAGDSLISLDNCEQPLGGELLCQAMTQRFLKIRILGKSTLVSLPTDTTFAATGNNLVISGDMTRRTIVSTLDPKVERPELREFSADPVEVIRGNRSRYVIAALTVLRAYFAAGLPSVKLRPIGSFGDWSVKIRNPLVWLGEADPCLTMDVARAQDPQTRALAEVLVQWRSAVGKVSVSVKRAAEIASESGNGDFLDALAVVAGERDIINPRRLGKWLSKNKGRVINGLRLESDFVQAEGKVARWLVADV